jgi:hypothetical protein
MHLLDLACKPVEIVLLGRPHENRHEEIQGETGAKVKRLSAEVIDPDQSFQMALFTDGFPQFV